MTWKTNAIGFAAIVATVRLVYQQWKKYDEKKETRQALRLLEQVELIMLEVAVRLSHIEKQSFEYKEKQSHKISTEEEEKEKVNSTLNSYYHFDSQGNKLKTKWDAYNVEAELKRLDQEEEEEIEENSNKTTEVPIPFTDPKKLLQSLGGLETEFEAVLSFLDGIRGNQQVKESRKQIATKITHEYFQKIDRLRTLLK